jgi:hypothetical protein
MELQTASRLYGNTTPRQVTVVWKYNAQTGECCMDLRPLLSDVKCQMS